MGKASFIPVNAGRLYHKRDGHGQPLVLLHSGGLHCGEWDDQFTVFCMSYLVVRYDRRGYGRSQMPKQAFSHVQDLHTVLTSLQLVAPALLGFSEWLPWLAGQTTGTPTALGCDEPWDH